jgi:hypothetical protein
MILHVRTNRFNFKNFQVLSTQCIYLFCVNVKRNNDFYPIQELLIGYNQSLIANNYL